VIFLNFGCAVAWLKPVIAEKAKERQSQGGRGEVVQKSAQAKTRDELAKVAGVSHDTIAKVEKIEAKVVQKSAPGTVT